MIRELKAILLPMGAMRSNGSPFHPFCILLRPCNLRGRVAALPLHVKCTDGKCSNFYYYFPELCGIKDGYLPRIAKL